MKSLSFLRSSARAQFIHKYCCIFLVVDVILICLIVYVWYTICEYNFCTTLPRKSRTNILAFGDSMTRGYVQGKLYYPYSKSLEKTVNRLHSSKSTVFVIDNAGLDGDTAIGMSKTRLHIALGKKKYEWVIMLFGTNDLWKHSYRNHGSTILDEFDPVGVDKVFKSLKNLCELALEEGRMLILGTVTARQCEDDNFYMTVCNSFSKNRQLLNEKIRLFVANSGAKMIILVDFDRDLNYKEMNQVKRKEYWQDNVHLTETGYEFMAKLIYKKMQPYLPAMIMQPADTRKITARR